MTYFFNKKNLCQQLSKQPVQSRKQLQEPENRFSLKNKACQAPHCCYKSASAYMSCVDNIPTVFAAAPLPLFSLLRVLVNLQPFSLAPFTFPSLSLRHLDLLRASFLSFPSKRSICGHTVIIEKMWDEMKANRINIVKTQRKSGLF